MLNNCIEWKEITYGKQVGYFNNELIANISLHETNPEKYEWVIFTLNNLNGSKFDNLKDARDHVKSYFPDADQEYEWVFVNKETIRASNNNTYYKLIYRGEVVRNIYLHSDDKVSIGTKDTYDTIEEAQQVLLKAVILNNYNYNNHIEWCVENRTTSDNLSVYYHGFKVATINNFMTQYKLHLLHLSDEPEMFDNLEEAKNRLRATLPHANKIHEWRIVKGRYYLIRGNEVVGTILTKNTKYGIKYAISLPNNDFYIVESLEEAKKSLIKTVITNKY